MNKLQHTKNLSKENNENNFEILYPYTIAKEFPNITQNLIERNHIVETIERLFCDTSVVFLEGEEGLGATTTLAQFVIHFPIQTFSLFIKPASRITYTIEYLRLVLAEQLSIYLDSTPLDKDVISPQEYNNFLFRLRRRASKKNAIYFVIDGLHKIYPDENSISQIFKDVLPIGWDNFKFLIVGEQGKFERYLAGTQNKYFQQLRFSLKETNSFMGSMKLDDEQLTTVHALCDGNPGKLASVQRLLRSGTSLDEILTSDPSKYLGFIRLEFSALAGLSDFAKSALAILAFSNRKISIAEIHAISKPENFDHIEEMLTSCKFLIIDTDNEFLEFVSDGHRKFASTNLAKYRNYAIGSHIEYLLNNPTSNIALTYLPTYYQQLDQTQELIRLLSSDHFTNLLELTESISSLRSRADLGVRSAISLKKAADVFGFSIKRSIFTSIASAGRSNSQVRALVALGDHAAALEIAYKSIANEERIAFLAAYARQRKESTDTVDDEILQYIRDTAKKIDFAGLGDIAIDLASDIVHVDPDLAMSIVDAALAGDADMASRDQAIARLSLETLIAKKGKKTSSGEVSGRKISDEKLQNFMASILALVSEYSAKEVMVVCGKLESHRQLEFLGYWIHEHAQQSDAIDIAEHGLNLMINNATYAPKMRDFAALASALAHSNDFNKVRKLIDRFDSQLGIIKEASASSSSVLLQLTLAHAESRFDLQLCATRVIECYYELSSIIDNDTKLEALATFCRSLSKIEKNEELELEHGFQCLVKDEMLNLLHSVLKGSAEHFLIAKPVIIALSIVDVSMAKAIAKSLNTEHRRDKAHVEILKSINDGVLSKQSIAEATMILQDISDALTRDQAYSNFLQNLAIRRHNISEDSAELLELLLTRMNSIVPKARSIVSLMKIRSNSGLEINSMLVDCLKFHVKLMDSSFDSAGLAFDACAASAKASSTIAKEFYTIGLDGNIERKINSSAFSDVLSSCLALSARAFGGAMRAKCFNEDMLTRFLRLSELIPSKFTRIDGLADLAARAWIADRLDIAKRLIDIIIPEIDSELRHNQGLAQSLLTMAYPAIFCCRPQIALSYSKKLPKAHLDLALGNALNLLIGKCAPSDPDSDEQRAKAIITYAEAVEATILIGQLQSDVSLYIGIKNLTSCISSKQNSLQFTANQRADLAISIETVYKKFLPDASNINHEGYVILCDANMVVLKNDIEVKTWNGLISRAERIENLADRGFLLAEIALIIPKKFSSLSMELQKKASDVFITIPSTIDKINRLIGLSDGVKRNGIAIAKHALKAALEMTLVSNNTEHASSARRQIIDVAEKIGPDFADELSESIDSDPAREHARSEVSERLRMLAVKKKLSNTKDNSEITVEEIQHLPEAAWKNVSGLIAGRVQTTSPDHLISYLQKSSSLDLGSAFPVLSWYVENCVRKYQHIRQSSPIEPLCESLILTSELAANVMLKVTASNKNLGNIFIGEIADAALIGISNRIDALNFISQWLEECKDNVILCDPFFGGSERDFDFLKLILSNCADCEVTILTSKKHLADEKISTDEQFLERWNESSDQNPPMTKIVGIALADGTKSVIHDRWLLCGTRGLRLGTSFNGIGTGKLSEISRLNDTETIVTSGELNKFIANERVIAGMRVSYLTYTV